jgi:hypothetical protein
MSCRRYAVCFYQKCKNVTYLSRPTRLYNTRDTVSLTFVLVADAEVAADGERLLLDLGLLFDFRFRLDLRRTLRLALDPLRARQRCGCRFARRAPVLTLAVRAPGARRAVAFRLPVRAGVALRAAVFHLAVRAGVAVRAEAFQPAVRTGVVVRAEAFQPAVRAGVARRAGAFHLPVGAGAAHSAVAFQLPVRAGVALRAAAFHLAVGTRVTLGAPVFQPSMRAPLLSHHYPPPRALTSALRAPRRRR